MNDLRLRIKLEGGKSEAVDDMIASSMSIEGDGDDQDVRQMFG